MEGKLPDSRSTKEHDNTHEGAKSSFNILALSDIAGGSRYMDNDALVGLTSYIETLDYKDKPDIVIINGFFFHLPWLGSTLTFDKIEARSSGIEYLEDIAAIMKPHLVRLMDALPAHTKIVVALGTDDWKNIDTIEQSIKAEQFKNGIEHVKARIDEVNDEIASVTAIIKTAEISSAKLNEQIKAEPENYSLLSEKLNVIEKIKQRKEELADLKEMLKPLLNLYSNELMKMKTEDIDELIKQEYEKQKKVTEALESLGKGNTEEYLKLSSTAKNIANTLSRLTKRQREAINSEAKIDETKKMAQALVYTHNVPLSKESEIEISSFVNAYYSSIIKDAFARKRHIIIQSDEEVLGAEDGILEGSRNLVFSNTGVYAKKLFGDNLNVIVFGSSRGYNQKSNDAAISELYNKIANNIVNGKEIEAAPINVLITGHNMHSSFSIKPLFNKGSIAAALACGPFWDKELAARLAERNNRVEAAKAVQKEPNSCAANMLHIMRDGMQHDIITMHALKAYADDTYKYDAMLAKSKIRKINNIKKTLTNGVESGRRDKLDLRILNNKLISELKDEDLLNNNIRAIIAKKVRRGAEAAPLGEPKDIKIGLISDVHIGNYADLEIFGKSVDILSKKNPDILVLGGDMIEGNFNNYKNVPRETNKIEYHDNVKKELMDMGYNSSYIEKFMARLYSIDEKKALQNIEEQGTILVDLLAELVYSTLKKGGTVIIVSGNHYNGTTKGWQYDEATEEGKLFATYIKGKEGIDKADELLRNMKIIRGSESGGDTIPINLNDAGELLKMRVSHNGGSNKISGLIRSEERSKSDAETKVVLSGHYHEYNDIYAFGKFFVTAPAMQDSIDNPYLSRINVPVSDDIKGCAFVDIEMRNGKAVVAKMEPILKLWNKDEFDIVLDEVNKRLRTASIMTDKGTA